MAPTTPSLALPTTANLAVALGLAVLLPLATPFDAPFNNFGPCTYGVGMCRRESPASERVKVAPSAAEDPLQIISLRFPCTEESTCKANIDVVRPALPPKGPNVTRCSTTLVPWSPFPCSFNTSQFNGGVGQPTDLCYMTGSGFLSPFEGFDLVGNLTTDGYNNVFNGLLPAQLSQPGCSGVSLQQATSLVLAIDFRCRVAAGNQYERTYWFTIGDAVAAFGTTSEPALTADKTWSTSLDITYLQSYLRPSQPTRFVLSNTFAKVERVNVPIWATVRLHAYYQTRQPLPALDSDPAAAPDVTVQKAEDPMDWQEQLDRLKDELLASPSGSQGQVVNASASAEAARAADVPDEVVPLVLRQRTGLAEAFEGMNFLKANLSSAGSNTSARYWPNVTFSLPASLPTAGNIYRAQLLLTPKADECEEFWALGPVNATCSGYGRQQTGEPYRELRVYLDRQLAGFSPIYFTTFTGGIDPRLWDAITAANTYRLPSYTFDLSPWLGRLNNRNRTHSIIVEINQQTANRWLLAGTLLLWRADAPVTPLGPPRVVLSPDLQQQVRSSCDVRSTVVNGISVQSLQDCRLLLQGREMASTALLLVGEAELVAAVRYRLLQFDSRTQTNATEFLTADGRPATTSSWRLTSSYEAGWYVGGRAANGTTNIWDLVSPTPARAASILTQSYRRFEWLNSGTFVPKTVQGQPFENSFNETLRVPTVYRTFNSNTGGSSRPAVIVRGQQRHYQRALDLAFNRDAECVVPRFSHTVSLNSSIAIGARSREQQDDGGCVTWRAGAAYCIPQPIENMLRTSVPCIA